MKKFILKLDLHDNKDKRKALKLVSTLSGIDLIAMDMKDRKLTVVGTVDPISVVSKLRKFWPTHIELVGPAKEPEKKEEPKKEEGKKEEGKKEEGKKEEEKKEEGKKEEGKKEGEEGKKDEAKKDETKKEEPKKEEEKKAEAAVVPMQMQMPMPMPIQVPVGMVMQPYSHRSYYPAMNTHYMNNYHGYNFQAHHPSIEENPNACVIC